MAFLILFYNCLKLLQLCPTLWNPMNCMDPTDCSPPGSSTHGILQARILEWVACHLLLQGKCLTQELNLHLLCLLHLQVGSLPLVPPGKPPLYKRFVNISLLVECIFLDEMLRRKVSSGAASQPSGLSIYPGQQKEHCPQSSCIISFSPKCLCFVNWKAVLVCVPWKQNLKQVLGRKEFFLGGDLREQMWRTKEGRKADRRGTLLRSLL